MTSTTPHRGDVEEIMGLLQFAPNRIIYVCSPHANLIERLELSINPGTRQHVTQARTVDDRTSLTWGPYGTILIFNGRDHWDSYVPTTPPPPLHLPPSLDPVGAHFPAPAARTAS